MDFDEPWSTSQMNASAQVSNGSPHQWKLSSHDYPVVEDMIGRFCPSPLHLFGKDALDVTGWTGWYSSQRLSNMERRRRQHNRHRMGSAISSRWMWIDQNKTYDLVIVGRFHQNGEHFSSQTPGHQDAITKFNRGFPSQASDLSDL